MIIDESQPLTTELATSLLYRQNRVSCKSDFGSTYSTIERHLLSGKTTTRFLSRAHASRTPSACSVPVRYKNGDRSLVCFAVQAQSPNILKNLPIINAVRMILSGPCFACSSSPVMLQGIFLSRLDVEGRFQGGFTGGNTNIQITSCTSSSWRDTFSSVKEQRSTLIIRRFERRNRSPCS